MGEGSAGFILGLILGASIVCLLARDHYEALIISRGYGLYCPVDGHFAFKTADGSANGECDK